MVANNKSHARKLACKGMAFVIRECCEATLFIYLSLATTYIEMPAFAGVSMYYKYNIIHRDYDELENLYISEDRFPIHENEIMIGTGMAFGTVFDIRLFWVPIAIVLILYLFQPSGHSLV